MPAGMTKSTPSNAWHCSSWNQLSPPCYNTFHSLLSEPSEQGPFPCAHKVTLHTSFSTSHFASGIVTFKNNRINEIRYKEHFELQEAFQAANKATQFQWIWFDGSLADATLAFLHELTGSKEFVEQLLRGGRARGGKIGTSRNFWFAGSIPTSAGWTEIAVVELKDLNCVVSVWGDSVWRSFVKGRLSEDGIGSMVSATIEILLIQAENIGHVVDDLEKEVVEEQGTGRSGVVGQVRHVRNESGRLRRTAWAWRGALHGMHKGDEIGLVLDVVEGYREACLGILEVHLAHRNLKMQEVMQTLAVVTTIFVPLTFLAGIEGMNFTNQPELHGRWSYGIFWMVVGAVVVAEIAYFKRKGWI